jgi:DNA-binding NtrC family response regulator
MIEAPSLCAQLEDSPGELERLVWFIVAEQLHLAGERGRSVVDDVLACIGESVPEGYAWPGNVRELEQCVRNVMVRGTYRPPAQRATTEMGRLTAGVGACSLSADELLRRYCSAVYAREGSYEGAARRLGLDRRTVRAKVDAGLVGGFRGEARTAP